MGVSLESYRSHIGLCQCRHASCSSSSSDNSTIGFSLRHVPVAALCLLLLIGGVEPNPGPSHKCKVCEQTFRSLSNYCDHVRLHASSRYCKSVKGFVIPCSFENCPAKLSSYDSFGSHLTRYHAWTKPSMALTRKEFSLPCPVEECSVVIPSREVYIKHMLKEHLQEGKIFTCLYKGCKTIIRRKGQFSTHMSRSHPEAGPSSSQFGDSQSPSTNDNIPFAEDDDTCNYDMDIEEGNIEQDAVDLDIFPDTAVKDELARFYLRLEAVNLLPTSVVQTIAEEIKLISELIHKKLKRTLSQELDRLKLPQEVIHNVLRVTFKSDPIFNIHHKGEDCDQLSTNHLRVNFWKKRFGFVDPIQIDLGLSDVNKKRFAHIVPIRESLNVLLRNPTVKEAVRKSFRVKANSEIMEDFTDSNVFKQHRDCQHTGGRCIQLLLFQDAFDPNAFAANTGAHKPVGFYFTVGNLPPEVRTQLNHIMLAYMILEKDMKPSVGDELNDVDRLKEALEPLVEQLRDLKANGIEIDGESVPVCLLFLIGDSLGQNYIGSFVRNFSSAQFWCRFCPMSKNEFLKNPYETKPFRTPDQYDSNVQIARLAWLQLRKSSLQAQKKARRQAASRANKVTARLSAPAKKRCLNEAISKSAYKKLLSVSYRGLKYRASPLNRQDLGFHVCSAQPPCLAHDLFEGIVKTILAKILEHFCDVKGWFNLDTLNRRINSFKCLGSDANDAPVCFKTFEKARGSACEVWNLLRLLPFMIGDLIQDKEDPVWEIYLQLKEITELVCAPKITMVQVAYLKSLIRDYLSNVQILFPSCLTPKHHFLCHYPDLISEFGPLIRLFTLRFESKHAFFKHVILKCHNYVNLTYTMARKYVARFAYDYSSQALSSDIVYDSPAVFNVLSLSQEMASVFPPNFEFDSVEVLRTVEIKGTLYKPGNYVVLNVAEESELMFGKIHQIFLQCGNGDLMFLLEEKLASNSFNGYYFLKKDQPSKYKLKCHQDLLDYYPLPGYSFNGQECISLKHSATWTDEK